MSPTSEHPDGPPPEPDADDPAQGEVASSAGSVPSSAARYIAQAHARLQRIDRTPTLVDTVRRFRRALPGDAAFGDPLSLAGEGGPRAVARAAGKIFPESNGASHEVGLAALQVWQELRERYGRGEGDAEVTLVFTDLVSFSGWSLDAGDEATLHMLRDVSMAIEPQITARGGHVVKRMGDGLFADFRSPTAAVEAMLAARAALADVDADGYRPVIRVGIHTGRPRRIGDDWLGVDVNIAARMMEAGRDGNVIVSETVAAALPTEWLLETGIKLKEHKRFFLSRARGVPDDLKMYQLVRIRG